MSPCSWATATFGFVSHHNRYGWLSQRGFAAVGFGDTRDRKHLVPSLADTHHFHHRTSNKPAATTHQVATGNISSKSTAAMPKVMILGRGTPENLQLASIRGSKTTETRRRNRLQEGGNQQKGTCTVQQ
ncbi:unnamed protein product [Ectocarpus sp. 13 AM-2016]